MRNFGKCIGISAICSVVFLGVNTQAATGTTLGTGSTSTGSFITTGTTTGITLPYTGSLLTYINAQESGVSALLATAYGQAYATFIKTGLNILKSVEYQSLVCLGAIKDVSLLSQMQKDKTALTIAFKQDFVELENQVLALEEKQALQTSDNVNVFDAGTTYESEKARIKDLIDAKVKLHQGFISSFVIGYATKNTDFLTTYVQYVTANASFLKSIQDKIAKVQSVLTAFSGVETTITAINAKVTGLDDLMQKMESSKTKGLVNMDTTLQPLIDATIKKYKNLQNIFSGLSAQKTYVVNQYQTDLNDFINNNFQTRYNRSQYLALKNEVNIFKAKYYTINNQLNCSNILATSDEGLSLLTKINTMTIAVNSGLVKISADGINSTFKDQLYSGFQSVYVQKFKQRYAEYTSYIKEYIKTALKGVVASVISTITTSPGISSTTQTKYVFTRPFNNGEYNEGIKALQNLLTTLQLYSGAIDGVYNKDTKNAVYKFQLSKGLLKGYEKKPATRGWMGPATRAALNLLTK